MPTPKPTAKVNADETFEKRFHELTDRAKEESEARQKGEQVRWDRPSDLTANVFDFKAMGKPFSRQAINDEGVSAVSDPEKPGTTGDIVAATTMIETLACMERAYRMRHTMTRPRAVAHSLSRKRGHGDPTGVFGRNAIEYLRQVIKQSRNNK